MTYNEYNPCKYPYPEPTNKEIVRLEKLITKHRGRIKLLKEVCEHELAYVSWNDGWNGYDYPAVTTGRTHYYCLKCGDTIIKESEVRHGC